MVQLQQHTRYCGLFHHEPVSNRKITCRGFPARLHLGYGIRASSRSMHRLLCRRICSGTAAQRQRLGTLSAARAGQGNSCEQRRCFTALPVIDVGPLVDPSQVRALWPLRSCSMRHAPCLTGKSAPRAGGGPMRPGRYSRRRAAQRPRRAAPGSCTWPAETWVFSLLRTTVSRDMGWRRRVSD